MSKPKVLRRRPQLHVPAAYARPMAPAAIQEAVQQWGRKSGRTAKLVWVPRMQKVWADGQWIWIDTKLECWAVEISLRPGHPSLRAWQEGRLKQDSEPTETVLLLTWDSEKGTNIPMRLEDYGAAGIVQFLEEADTWSGRGRFNSFQAAFNYATQRRRENAATLKAQMREWASDLYHDVRRRIKKIPFHRVGIDLKPEETPNG